jgi:hypothetical protein
MPRITATALDESECSRHRIGRTSGEGVLWGRLSIPSLASGTCPPLDIPGIPEEPNLWHTLRQIS